MINRLKVISSHTVAKNSIALFALQLVSMVAPLLVLPHLSRILGLDGFGLVMLAMSAIAIGVIISDYGFNLSATYAISKRRDDLGYVSELIGAVFFIKILLALMFIIAIFSFSYLFLPEMNSNTLALLIGTNVLVHTLIPTWFFQGIERMKNVTIYMVFAKIAYVFMVFAFVNNRADVELVLLLFAFSNFLAAIIAIRFIYINGYSVKLPSNIVIKRTFKDSSAFFISRAAVSIYTSASTFLVGAFSGVQQAAFYGASEKLYQASQSFTAPLAQALFPYMAKNQDSKLLVKITSVVGIMLFLGCSLVAVWAHELMVLVFGDEFYQSGQILQVFLAITVINFVTVIFGYPAFAGLGKVQVANYTVMFGAVVQFICLTVLYITDSFSGLYVVISVLITELSVMLSRIILYNYYK